MDTAEVSVHGQLGQFEPQMREDYGKGIRWSFIVHGGLLLFVVIKSWVFPSAPVVYTPTLRVDLVGLPDILKNDLKKVTHDPVKEEAAPKAEPEKLERTKVKEQADPDEMVLNPKKTAEKPVNREKKLKSALARIKALEKISAESDTPSSPLIKGNAISKGTSLSGDAKESAQASYYDVIRDRLQANWALPVWIARQNLSAQVRIFLDSRGRVHNFQFTKLSGNRQFDEAVKKTIQESAPFPTPPGELGKSLLVDGILVGFPL